MEEVLIESLRAQINFIKQTTHTNKKEKRSSSAECYKAIGQVEKELSLLQSRKMERYEAYRSGEISREDFIIIKENLTVQADELSTKKEQLESVYRDLLQAQKEEAEARTAINQAEQVLVDVDAGLREHLYEAIERVIVTTNEQIEIKWVFADFFAQRED